MAGQRRAKLDLDRARRAKAQAKRERRLTRPDDDEPAGVPDQDQGALLEQLRQLHDRFEAGAIDFTTFEETKASLIDQLT
jgi:hypothetical protein